MPGHLDDDTKRKIIEEEGLSVDSYNEANDRLEQMDMNMTTFQTIFTMATKKPARLEEAKAIRAKEVITHDDQTPGIL